MLSRFEYNSWSQIVIRYSTVKTRGSCTRVAFRSFSHRTCKMKVNNNVARCTTGAACSLWLVCTSIPMYIFDVFPFACVFYAYLYILCNINLCTYYVYYTYVLRRAACACTLTRRVIPRSSSRRTFTAALHVIQVYRYKFISRLIVFRYTYDDAIGHRWYHGVRACVLCAGPAGLYERPRPETVVKKKNKKKHPVKTFSIDTTAKMWSRVVIYTQLFPGRFWSTCDQWWSIHIII